MPRSLPANTLSLLLSVLLLGLLSACSSFASRAREKAVFWATMDATTQARLEARNIQIGDTTDMVYIALGNPHEKLEKTTAEGVAMTWIYSTFWDEYQGTRLVGYRQNVVYDPGSKKYQVSYRPDYQPVYTPRAEDRLRITFAAGRVTVVETIQTDTKPAAGNYR